MYDYFRKHCSVSLQPTIASLSVSAVLDKHIQTQMYTKPDK